MKRKTRKRLAKEAAIARKEAMGDFSHLKDKKGQYKAAPLPQPTLPKIGLDDLMNDSKSELGGPTANGGAYAYPPTLGYAESIQRVGTPASSYHGHGGNQRWANDEKYAESVHSWVPPASIQSPRGQADAGRRDRNDHFMSHQAPMGYQNGYGSHQRPQYATHGGHPQSQDSFGREDAFGSDVDRAGQYDQHYAGSDYASAAGTGAGYYQHAEREPHYRQGSYGEQSHAGSRALYGHGEGYREDYRQQHQYPAAHQGQAEEVDLAAYYGTGAEEYGTGYGGAPAHAPSQQHHHQHQQYR